MTDFRKRLLFRASISFVVLLVASAATHLLAADVAAVTDYTNYNAGSDVHIRLHPATQATAAIRYAGEEAPVVTAIRIQGSGYVKLWSIPWDARTGRYEVDLTASGGHKIRNATSFAVHRQLAKVMSLELDKTFYTSGDSVTPHIVVRNLSDRNLDNLQVEFEPYTYPWIAPAPDERPLWKHIVAASLSLPPRSEKEFTVENAAVVQAEKEPTINYYSVVIRDHRRPERIYDLAFAPPAFTVPPNKPVPKEYPFLYLYQHLSDVPKSETYRHFYPPEFVSDVITFETSHTMFPTGAAPVFSFSVKPRNNMRSSDDAYIRARVIDRSGKELENERISGTLAGTHRFTSKVTRTGLYTLEISVELAGDVTTARNRLEFAINDLPKSILVFCAHQDDDTAHPGIIRAAVENNIPIRFVYLTGGDAGGCDRYYMHSCDAARAMDFGEVRMEEARASLGHVGVPRSNIWFLGLPDGGLEEIWYHHVKADNPYLSVLLASDHSPYREAAKANLPFAREPIIAAIKEFITRFKPDMIITGHPDERHVDHRTNNWLVVKAMQELLKEGTISRDTQLVVDASYGPIPNHHAPYRYEKYPLHVSGEVARLGQEALWYYQSQDGNHEQANIIDYNKLPREEPDPHFRILDWYTHEGWNEKQP